MGTSSKDTTRYEFGNFRLDVEHNLLYRMEELLEPERRELALIRLLVENHPRTLTRQELMDALWPRQEVTDAALAQLVRRTRQLLGDNGRSPHYIKTVHGIGLRLIPQPHPLREAATDPLPEDHRFNRKAVEGPVRIGILPFVNHSGDSANDWVETALPQMLGQLLGENPDLLVVEAEQLQGYMLDNEISVEHFDDPQQREKPAQLLEDTGCHLLLHARLEAKFLPRILTCRVISREGPFVPFRVEAPDILAAGSKLANRVIALADPAQPWVVDARQTYSTNRSANQAYASGLQELVNCEATTAERYFRIALDLEPDFHWATERLASALYYQHRLDESRALIEALLARPELDSAIALHARHTLANIHYSRGELALSRDLSKELIEAASEPGLRLFRASELLNLGTCHQAMADNTEALRILEQALEEYSALEFGPGRGRALVNIGNVHHGMNQWEDAYRHYEKAEQLLHRLGNRNNAAQARFQRAMVLRSLQRVDEATTMMREVVEVFEQTGDREGLALVRIELLFTAFRQGQRDHAIDAMVELSENLANQELGFPLYMARHYLARMYLDDHCPEEAAGYIDEDAEFDAQNPEFCLLRAHLAYENHDFSRAVEIAETCRDGSGQAWLEKHQVLLDGYRRAALSGNWTELTL